MGRSCFVTRINTPIITTGNELCGEEIAKCSLEGKCPNVVCCLKKGYDGCYECDELEGCENGFYAPKNDGANAAKAQALYIGRHGKKAFLKVHDRLHKNMIFLKHRFF